MNKTFAKTIYIILGTFLPVFIYTLNYLDPRKGLVNIVIFIFSGFMVLSSTFAFLGFTFRSRKSNNEVLHTNVATSLRQGFLFGLYGLGILSLSAIDLLTWWDAALLALSLILFEIYFKSDKVGARNV